MTENQKRAVGVFSNRQATAQGLEKLQASGFPMEKVSIIGKDLDQDKEFGKVQTSDRLENQSVDTTTGVVADTLTTSTWGSVLVGLTSLALPGIGVVLAAGSLGVALATSVAGVAVGAAATHNLIKALANLGIPEEQARVYSDRLIQGDYLVIAEGTDQEIQNAQASLSVQDIHDLGIYDIP
jgi:hypothetical protein